jgi:hypothetical protein
MLGANRVPPAYISRFPEPGNPEEKAMTETICRRILFHALLLALAAPLRAQGAWVDIFNGKDTQGLMEKGGGAIAVKDGLLVGTGGTGYFATEKEYSRYRLIMDFRNVGGGNSGFAYHILREDLGCRLPSGIELNINGDDIGTLWWTDVKFKSNGGSSFKADGPVVSLGGFGCSGAGHKSFGRDKAVNPSKGATAWNTWEVLVDRDSMEAKLNGVVVMRAFGLKLGAEDVPGVKGKVGILLEGSEIHVRNWRIQELDGTTSLIAIPKPSRRGEPALSFDSRMGILTVRARRTGASGHFSVLGEALPAGR